MIELAGFLSIKLSVHISGKAGSDKVSASMTPAERKARAKKAANKRWGKA